MDTSTGSLLKRTVPAVLIAVPLLYLLVDLARTPVLLNGCRGTNDGITLQTLVDKQAVSKGSYMGHTFYVSLDSIQDSHYLDFVKWEPTALVIGVDRGDPSQRYSGPLPRAVEGKLATLSPADAKAFRRIVEGGEPSLGYLKPQPLQIPERSKESFPVDYLYIVGIRAVGNGDVQAKEQQGQIFQKGIRRAMEEARKDRVSNLIIPFVGVDPENQKTLQFGEWFSRVFAATEMTSVPPKIYLSMFHGWRGDYRGKALIGLHEAWAEACSASSKESVLVREELRLVLVGIFICLLVSSLHVAMTIKNFLIISAAFAGLGFGAFQLLHPFVQDWNPDYRLIAAAAVLLFLAVAFPYLPKMNPKDLFDKRDNGNE